MTEDFAAELAWRLGDGAGGAREAQALREISLNPPGAMLGLAILDSAAGRFLPVNGFDQRIVAEPGTRHYALAQSWPHIPARWLGFANDVGALGLEAVFVLNFMDAQSWDYPAELGAGFTAPVFQSARRTGQRGVVLWPAQHYHHGPDSENCPADPADTLTLGEKLPRAVWRGQLTGVHRHRDQMFWAAPSKREIFAQAHALSQSMLAAMFHAMPRFGFVARHQGQDFCDVGLVHEPSCEHHQTLVETDPRFAPWRNMFRPRLDRAAQLRYRFLIALEGNDSAAGLFWALNSNSVVMMPQPVWQTILHFGLTAWEHYIPLAPDCSDLAEKIAWGNAHLDDCAQIASRARRFMAVQNHRDRRAELDRAVLRGYLG